MNVALAFVPTSLLTSTMQSGSVRRVFRRGDIMYHLDYDNAEYKPVTEFRHLLMHRRIIYLYIKDYGIPNPESV